MMLMVGDHNSSAIHYWAGKYPGKIGRLLGPRAFETSKVKLWLPWAFDNDAYSAYTNGTPWDEGLWCECIRKIAKLKHAPRWVLVPDVVADKASTLKQWDRLYPFVKDLGLTTAFAAQDGMKYLDIPKEAEVVFIGGSTHWKWRNFRHFCNDFSRVHVGRVNTIDRCFLCQDAGAESVDGTGWFRDGTGDWRFEKIEHFLSGRRIAELALT